MFIFNLSRELITHMSKCLPDTSTWVLNKYPKFSTSKQNSWSSFQTWSFWSLPNLGKWQTHLSGSSGQHFTVILDFSPSLQTHIQIFRRSSLALPSKIHPESDLSSWPRYRHPSASNISRLDHSAASNHSPASSFAPFPTYISSESHCTRPYVIWFPTTRLWPQSPPTFPLDHTSYGLNYIPHNIHMKS